MKRKFSKILGVGLALSLLASLLLVAAPVLADVSQPTVDVDPDEISDWADYTIIFVVANELAEGGTISITFPEDTDIIDITDAADADVTISATSGIGSTAFNATAAGSSSADTTLTITLPDVNAEDKIGAGATVQVVVSGVVNPSVPGDYTLKVKTSKETTYVESESYGIEVPVVGGFVYVYNSSDILLAAYGGSAALNDAEDDGYFSWDDFTIKVGPGTYVLGGDLTITGKGLTLESSEGAEDTIIDADGNGLQIAAGGEDVVIDGFTIEYADEAILISADGVTVTNNIITDASVAGIEIVVGIDATVSDNVIEDCADGIYLYESSNNTVSGNTCNSNGENGIRLYDSDNNTIYLNNFSNNTVNVCSEGSTNTWHTPEQITYIYHGNTYTHYLGNYWSDYLGSDSDGDGIGDTPYSIDGDNDNCPLMEPFENYSTSPCFIATASYDAPSNQDITALRSFRDKVLAKSSLGEALVKVYYSTSPPVAGALAQNEGLRTATRLLLVTPLSYLARTFSHLASFIILATVVLGLLFLARRRKLARTILKSFGMGLSTTAALTATVFSLGYTAYTWSFCGTMAAYILPMILPLSIVVAVILTLRPSKIASRSSSPPPPDLPV